VIQTYLDLNNEQRIFQENRIISLIITIKIAEKN